MLTKFHLKIKTFKTTTTDYLKLNVDYLSKSDLISRTVVMGEFPYLKSVSVFRYFKSVPYSVTVFQNTAISVLVIGIFPRLHYFKSVPRPLAVELGRVANPRPVATIKTGRVRIHL